MEALLRIAVGMRGWGRLVCLTGAMAMLNLSKALFAIRHPTGHGGGHSATLPNWTPKLGRDGGLRDHVRERVADA